MKFPNVLTMLYCEPWLILSETHRRLCQIVDAHIDGSAHNPGGLIEQMEKVLADEPQAGIQGGPRETRKPYELAGSIALIPMHGVIGKRVGCFEKMSGAVDVDDVERLLDAALGDDDVEGILLHIDSPGGTVTGVPELANKVAAATSEKRVLSFTDNMAASAAYWIGCGADEFYAAPSASTGSIGVYLAWLDVSRAYEMGGYKTELIKVGRHKAVGLAGTTLSDEQRDLLTARVEQIGVWFKGFVSAHREGVAAESMEGQTFYGRDAKAAGLVDEIGSLSDAIERLRFLISLEQDAG